MVGELQDISPASRQFIEQGVRSGHDEHPCDVNNSTTVDRSAHPPRSETNRQLIPET